MKGGALFSKFSPILIIPRSATTARSVSVLRGPSAALRPLVAAIAPLRRQISGVRCLSTRATTSSLNDPSPNWSNRPPKETILLDGCDFEHWLVVLEPPDPSLTRDQIIDSYIKTLAQVVGSEEEARMKIYSVSTKHYFAFGCLVSEELSYKIKTLPMVRWVLPDSYLDVRNKDYGGEPFIDGKAVPYDPKYHEEWVRNNQRSQERSRRNDRPRNFDRSRNFERRRENMQNRDFQNTAPPMPPRDMPPAPNPAAQNAMPTRDVPPMTNMGGMPGQGYQNQMPNTQGGAGYQRGGAGHQGGGPGYQGGGPGHQGGGSGYQVGGPGHQGGGPSYQGGNTGYQGGGPNYQGGGSGYQGGYGYQGGPGGPSAYQGSGGPGYDSGGSTYQWGGGPGYQGADSSYQGREMTGRDSQ